MLPIAFLTYCPWPFEHTAHDLWRIRQQETFVVDQSFGVGGTGARCGGAPQVPFTQVFIAPVEVLEGFSRMHVVRSMRVRGANKTLKKACRKPPKSGPDVPKLFKIEPGALRDI